MNMRFNEDEEVVKSVKAALVANGGFCPTKADKYPANKCMCQEFRQQISDPSWSGECHCGLYVKEL